MPTSTLTPPVTPSCPQGLPDPGASSHARPGAHPERSDRVSASDKVRFGVLCGSHAMIDVFPIFFTTLAWALRERLHLTDGQFALLFITGPIFSGMTQPVFAWLTDKHDTRLCGPVGLIIGAACISSIGFAQNFWQLFILQAVGVMATGMYHPIGTALAGQIGTRFLRNGRGQAIGLFIAAGMLGQAIGPLVASEINHFNGGRGMPWLVILIPPAILTAAILHAFTRRVAHRHGNHHELRAAFTHEESRRRWKTIALLTAQNSLRFTTNVGMFAMYNVWAKSKILDGTFATEAERASAASALTGALASGLTIGMGIAVILGGRLVKRGDEKLPLFWWSVLGAIGTVAMGYVGDWSVARAGGTTWVALLPVHLCGAIAAMGFFATFPIATSLAQRLQPGHTGMVTSLMMGVGWGISAAAAPLAEVFFGGVSMAEATALPEWRINIGFLGFGALLLIAGALTLFIPRDLVHKATEHH